MRGHFKETVVDQNRGIAAHEPVQTIKEQTGEVGRRRQLPDLLDIALPALERCRVQRAVVHTMIGAIQPYLESRVQILQGAHLLTIDAGQKLFAHRSEESLNLATSLGLIRRRVNNQDP